MNKIIVRPKNWIAKLIWRFIKYDVWVITGKQPSPKVWDKQLTNYHSGYFRRKKEDPITGQARRASTKDLPPNEDC